MKIASFAQTGNIEVLHGGKRELIGQLVDGALVLNRAKVTEIGKRAYERIDVCAEIVQDYGRPLPALVWKETF
jgi:hypothetical protein